MASSNNSRLLGAAQKISGLADDRLRKAYARALRESIQLDLDNLQRPRVSSPSLLHDKYGIALDQQLQYGISLTKQEALLYLTSDCGMKIKQSRVNRELTRSSYDKRFRRKCSRLNAKALLFSCAEVQHLLRHEFQLTFPAELEQYT